jgi:uncharacterized protein YciI
MPRDPNIPDAFDVYTLILLRRPVPAPDLSEDDVDHLQAQHLAYRADLKRQGKIVANGPFRDQSDVALRGLSIFTCDLDEARRLSDADPMVKAGWLAYDVFEWWIAAGTIDFPGVDGPVGRRRSMSED